jgi:hypothetical protein
MKSYQKSTKKANQTKEKKCLFEENKTHSKNRLIIPKKGYLKALNLGKKRILK